MLDRARTHRRKRGPLPKREEIPLLDTSAAKHLFRSIKEQWPGFREKIETYVNKGKEKLGDAYASVARALAAQKEAYEDRRAERKERERAPSPGHKASAASHAKKSQH